MESRRVPALWSVVREGTKAVKAFTFKVSLAKKAGVREILKAARWYVKSVKF